MLLKPIKIFIAYNEDTFPFAQQLYKQIASNFRSYIKYKNSISTQEFLIRLIPFSMIKDQKCSIIIAPPNQFLKKAEDIELRILKFKKKDLQIISYERICPEWEKLLSKT